MNDKSHSFPDYTYWQLLLLYAYTICVICHLYHQIYSLLMIVACSALYIMILIVMLGSNEMIGTMKRIIGTMKRIIDKTFKNS